MFEEYETGLPCKKTTLHLHSSNAQVVVVGLVVVNCPTRVRCAVCDVDMIPRTPFIEFDQPMATMFEFDQSMAIAMFAHLLAGWVKHTPELAKCDTISVRNNPG